jgi:hypothetical protein
MPARSAPPNRPPPADVDRLVDAVAWAKTCLLIAAATPPGGAERARELENLRRAVVEPRRLVDEIFGRGQGVRRSVIVDLRACKLAVPKLEAGLAAEAILQPSGGAV